jgi:hypothetical protein
MRIRTINCSSTYSRSRNRCASKALACVTLMAVFFFGQASCFEASAQTGGGAKPQASGTADAPPNQSVAPIGNTGYMVPIPEIKMNRIIGDKTAPPSAPAPPKEPPSVTPAPAEEPPPAQDVEPPAPAEPQVEQKDQPAVKRLPFEHPDRSPSVERPPEQTPAQELPEKEYRSPLSQPPAVPEDIMDAPVPKKELLGKKAAPTIPPLLDLEPVKRASKANPLESIKARDEADSKERIPLDPRREAESIPALEPEAPAHKEDVKEIQEEAPNEPLPPPESAAPLAVPPVEPLLEPVQKEPIPSAITPPAVEEPAEPEPPQPAVEQPAPPVKEALPSPLAQEALNSPEVWEYLRETAPLLEELSLLMTRAPSLNLADYDPSDSEAPIVPKEIYLKMDSMKRELQNLDSKTFSIIPPPKYVPFHAVIRESITETYQACDSIIGYLNERNDENLQKVMDHLNKARELIRQTRTIEG